MEIHQLKYFMATAQSGSITRAARVSRISQPSLSVQLAKLESELGGPLFERGKKGARLTARGEHFLPHARAVLLRLERAADELASLDRLDRGRVTLGCLPMTGAHLLPAVLKTYRQKWPKVTVELIEASSPGLSIALEEGRADIAILDEAGLGKGLESIALFSEPLVLAVPPGHRLVKSKQVHLSLLGNEPFIMMKSGSGFRDIVQRAFETAGIEPDVVMESGEIETVQSMVGAGLGLALVPQMVRKPGGPVYLELARPVPQRTLSLAWRRGASLSPAAEKLAEHIKVKLKAHGLK